MFGGDAELLPSSEDFADRSFDAGTSSPNYPQWIESAISLPNDDASLWLLGIVTIGITLGGPLHLALVASRRFPHRCFLVSTRGNCDFLVFASSDCGRGIYGLAAESRLSSFSLEGSSCTAPAPSHMLAACSQLLHRFCPDLRPLVRQRTRGAPRPRTEKVHPTRRDMTSPAFPSQALGPNRRDPLLTRHRSSASKVRTVGEGHCSNNDQERARGPSRRRRGSPRDESTVSREPLATDP